MSKARFAEILYERRRRLGLTTSQAAKVLRYREGVIIAFEQGDFDHLPALGYAQSMLSGYARYLGLDPRELCELYSREHDEYVGGGRPRASRSLPRLADEPNQGGSLSGVSEPRVGSWQGAGEGYAPYGSYAESYDRRLEQRRGRAEGPRGERRYTARQPEGGVSERERRQSARAARRAHEAGDYGPTGARRPRGSYDDGITTRDARSSNYRDDLRYEVGARPYRSASSGRGGSRRIERPARPNVRRRDPRRQGDPRERGRGTRRNRPQGVVGVIQDLFADPRRAIGIVAIALVIVLAVIILISVRSCATGKEEARLVSVTQQATSAAATTSDPEAERQALSEAAAREAALSAQAALQETRVKVSVADGKTSWVEVVSDGESKVADTVTGPWEQEYVVKDEIKVGVGDTGAVSVEKNGEKVPFTSKASGISSLTVKGTDPAAATTAPATGDPEAPADGDAADEEGAAAQDGEAQGEQDASGTATRGGSGLRSAGGTSKGSSNKTSER